jgi:regulator of replication initiation timing
VFLFLQVSTLEKELHQVNDEKASFVELVTQLDEEQVSLLSERKGLHAQVTQLCIENNVLQEKVANLGKEQEASVEKKKEALKHITQLVKENDNNVELNKGLQKQNTRLAQVWRPGVDICHSLRSRAHASDLTRANDFLTLNTKLLCLGFWVPRSKFLNKDHEMSPPVHI